MEQSPKKVYQVERHFTVIKCGFELSGALACKSAVPPAGSCSTFDRYVKNYFLLVNKNIFLRVTGCISHIP